VGRLHQRQPTREQAGIIYKERKSTGHRHRCDRSGV
jgi:hypothetical protein